MPGQWRSSPPTTWCTRRWRPRPYPGVADGLRVLVGEGWKLAVCTNKPERAARALLAALGLAERFAAIGGGDSFPVRKPDPAHLLATLRAAGGDPAHAVMAGDHANDVAAARGAGVPCIFAGWGYGPLAMAEGAAAVADDFDGLVGGTATGGLNVILAAKSVALTAATSVVAGL